MVDQGEDGYRWNFLSTWGFPTLTSSRLETVTLQQPLINLSTPTYSSLCLSLVACTTPDDRQGSCINLRQCTELYNIVAFKRPLTNEDRNYLSSSQCGYYNNQPLVKRTRLTN